MQVSMYICIYALIHMNIHVCKYFVILNYLEKTCLKSWKMRVV